ncbi:MAG: ribosomal protein S18-alanine N-acetyltransferase [Candidatus Sulfotelmatobacter sp.]
MNIRAATPDDVSSMMGLASASESAAHWTPDQYRTLFSSDEPSQRLALVAEHEVSSVSAIPPIDGFVVARHVAPDWELENIVVAPAARRQGIGGRLLDALVSAARETNSAAVFLEVRESNNAARRLYENSGFQQQGRRKSYYSNSMEDAILYCRHLG